MKSITSLLICLICISSFSNCAKLRQNAAADLLNLGNVFGTGSSTSSGTTGLSLPSGSGSTLNTNNAGTSISAGTSSGAGFNSGSSGSSINGGGAANTASVGGSSATIGSLGAAGNSSSSGAIIGMATNGTLSANSTDGSGSAVAFGNNTGLSTNAGATAIGLNSGSTGAATTGGSGTTALTANSGTGTNTGASSGNLSGSGAVATGTTGNTAITAGTSSGNAGNNSSGSISVSGNGTGSTSSTGTSSVTINSIPTGAPTPTTPTPPTSTPVTPATPITGSTGGLTYVNPPFYSSTVSNNMFNYIPKQFWINASGAYGTDFVAFIGKSGRYLTCDCNGLLSSSAKASAIAVGQMWIPVLMSSGGIALRNYYGGYLGINADNTVDCKSRVIYTNQVFSPSITGGPNNEVFSGTFPKYFALKGINSMFIGIHSDKTVAAAAAWASDNGNLFTGPIAASAISASS